MTSTPTTRNRFMKQADGDNTNTWGDVMNAQVFDMIDASLDGWAYLTPAGPVTLTTANGATDQARLRGLKYQAGSVAATTTLPAVEKLYLVWNASTADQTLASQGGGTTCVVRAGEVAWIATDATNVVRATLLSMESKQLSNVTDPTSAQQAATKNYVDTAIAATAFSMGAFGVPIAAGDSGKLLTNNGATPSWTNTPTLSTLTVTGAAAAASLTVTGAVAAGSLTVGGVAAATQTDIATALAKAIAFAVAL